MAEQLTPEAIEQAPDLTPEDVFDTETILQALAQLSLMAYDQCRQAKAKFLKIRVSTLDAEVEARRPKSEEHPVTAPGATTPPEPWTEAVNGAALLTALADIYTKYAVLPSGAAETLACWTAFTYVFQVADVNPRIQLSSPLKRCGKTRVLETLSLLVSRPLPASNVSPSAVFRVIEQSAPTMLIDEADSFVRDNEELRGLLNSGHTRRTAFVLRSVPVGDNQWEARTFSTWAPMALAGIGRLFPTLEDRSIRIVLKRKLPTEKVPRLPVRNDAEPFVSLRRQCTRWGHDHLEAIRSADPAQPPGLNDRAADNWRPLLAIAAVAGGDWPARVQQAIVRLQAAAPDEAESGALLLQDLQAYFADQDAKHVSSEELAKALVQMEERPWSEYGRQHKPISVNQIARLLKPFDIHPKQKWDNGVNHRGYHLDDCAEVFSRYTTPFQSARPLDPNNDTTKHENQTASKPRDLALWKSQNPASNNDPSGLAVSNGEIAGKKDINGALPSVVGHPGVPLAYSTPSGQRLPCTLCGGSERWQDGQVWRCVRCWPPVQPGRG